MPPATPAPTAADAGAKIATAPETSESSDCDDGSDCEEGYECVSKGKSSSSVCTKVNLATDKLLMSSAAATPSATPGGTLLARARDEPVTSALLASAACALFAGAVVVARRIAIQRATTLGYRSVPGYEPA
jgi:hypothetical protein